MAKCPVCGFKTEEHKEVYFSNFNNQEYKLYNCQVCKLHWWEPLQISPEFYEQSEDYVLFHMGLNEEIGKNHRMFFEYMPLKTGRLLDVGCGDGVTHELASKGTSLYHKLPLWRRAIFKSLKGIRFLVFLPFVLSFALYVYISKSHNSGSNLYFQARYGE